VPRQADEWTPVKRGERADSAERVGYSKHTDTALGRRQAFPSGKRETGILNEELV